MDNTANLTETYAGAVRVRESGAGVESLYRRGLTWVSFQPLTDAACGIDFAIRKLPGLGLLSGTVHGVRHEHAIVNTHNGNDDLSLHINVCGQSIVAGRRGEFSLQDGEAVLLSYSTPRTITRPGLVDHRVIRLPRASLAPLVHNIDDLLLRAIPRGTGPLNLLTHYIGVLIDDPVLAAPEMRQLIIHQLCDLIAATLGATCDTAAVAEGRGIRAVRLRAIKNDIYANVTRDDLTPGKIAKRHNISESYIRKLFEAEGTSFSKFVQMRRLVLARRMLTDQRMANLSIAAIAFECGFGDLSYFNRSFKSLYGARPSEIRAGFTLRALEKP